MLKVVRSYLMRQKGIKEHVLKKTVLIKGSFCITKEFREREEKLI